MGTGIDGGHWFIKKRIRMNENAFTAISFPFLPPHPAAYVRTHVACQVQPHMNFYKLAQRKKKSNFLSCVLSHCTQLFFFFFILLRHVQSIRDARLKWLAHKPGCIDFLKGCEGSPRLLNVPPKDLLCSHIMAGAPLLHAHLIAQLPQ